jgi:hypothetical protein
MSSQNKINLVKNFGKYIWISIQFNIILIFFYPLTHWIFHVFIILIYSKFYIVLIIIFFLFLYVECLFCLLVLQLSIFHPQQKNYLNTLFLYSTYIFKTIPKFSSHSSPQIHFFIHPLLNHHMIESNELQNKLYNNLTNWSKFTNYI